MKSTLFTLFLVLTLVQSKPLFSTETSSAGKITAATIEQKIQKFQETHLMNGAVAVAIGDEAIYAAGFGVADNSTTPIQLCTPDTQFFIGSVTKQFTAAAILHVLYARLGTIDALREALHKPLSKYLTEADPIWAGDMPAWANHVTLHHLLTHTSGIFSYTSVESFKRNLGNPISAAELASTFKNEPVRFEPGLKFECCNSGYFLLGEVVARLSGVPFSHYLAEHFFKPLGMTHTFLPDDGTGKTMKDSGDYPNLALGYAWNIDNSLTEISPYWHNNYAGGAGGIVSTVNDLVVWNKNLHNDRVLPAEVTALMLTGFVRPNEKDPYCFYCYGIERSIQDEKLIFAHNGGLDGFQTTLFYRPSDQLSFVSFQNIGLEPKDKQKLYAAEDEAREQFKELRANDRKKYEEAFLNVLETRVPAELETRRRTLPIRLGDILK